VQGAEGSARKNLGRPNETTKRACEPDGYGQPVNLYASQLAEQARSRDYDPGDKRGQTGK